MAQVKVEVTNANVGGFSHGETLLVDKEFAEMLTEKGYAKIVEDTKDSDEKTPKKEAAKDSKKK